MSEFHTLITKTGENSARFVIEPLNPSFAASMGTALRRTLLAAIPGMAITAVKVGGVDHFFSTIPGVKEAVLDIVLNLKKVRFERVKEGVYTLKLVSKKIGAVHASDLQGDLKVINGDLYLAEITTKTADLTIECIVSPGYGFVSSEDQKETPTGFTSVDSTFSPVKLVNFTIEQARVGSRSNYERLIIDVTTDGSITPTEAVKESKDILIVEFDRFMSGKDQPKDISLEPKKMTRGEVSEQQAESKVLETIIDELNLPSRVINALLRENIETVSDLLKRGKNELVVLKGVGRKSIDLIEEELNKLGVSLD